MPQFQMEQAETETAARTTSLEWWHLGCYSGDLSHSYPAPWPAF